jgi:hypothetical protein
LSKTVQRPQQREPILFAGTGLECLGGLLCECARFFEIQTAPMSLLLQCLCSEFPRLSGIGAWRMGQESETLSQ